jgi:hypothetical protein
MIEVKTKKRGPRVESNDERKTLGYNLSASEWWEEAEGRSLEETEVTRV